MFELDPADSAPRQATHGPGAEAHRRLQLAPCGAGPLLQRDYVVVLEGSLCTPVEVVEKILADFPRFSPAELARFSRPPDARGLLDRGDTMQVEIRELGTYAVRVTHVVPHSLTLATLEGHPEAGRITFGACRDRSGRLVCRIRSRSRQRDRRMLSGWFFGGKRGQTEAWVVFLERLAAACGGQVLGHVIVATDMVNELPEDQGAGDAPTFVCAPAC